jgi:hypothetical protein
MGPLFSANGVSLDSAQLVDLLGRLSAKPGAIRLMFGGRRSDDLAAARR